jgi:hypothetical protein
VRGWVVAERVREDGGALGLGYEGPSAGQKSIVKNLKPPHTGKSISYKHIDPLSASVFLSFLTNQPRRSPAPQIWNSLTGNQGSTCCRLSVVIIG